MFKSLKESLTEDVVKPKKQKKGFLQETKYLDSHLNEGEYGIYRAHLSWIPVFVRQVPFMILGGIAGGIAWGISGDFLLGQLIQAGAWGVGIIGQIHQIYKNMATDILLTNQGIHSKYKLFAIEDDQFTKYAKVNDAELTYNSVFQRLLEYGDITITTIAGTDDNYTFKAVAKPASLKRAVRAAMSKYDGGGYGGGSSMMGGNFGRPMDNQNSMMNAGNMGGMNRMGNNMGGNETSGSGRGRRSGNRRRGRG